MLYMIYYILFLYEVKNIMEVFVYEKENVVLYV